MQHIGTVKIWVGYAPNANQPLQQNVTVVTSNPKWRPEKSLSLEAKMFKYKKMNQQSNSKYREAL